MRRNHFGFRAATAQLLRLGRGGAAGALRRHRIAPYCFKRIASKLAASRESRPISFRSRNSSRLRCMLSSIPFSLSSLGPFGSPNYAAPDVMSSCGAPKTAFVSPIRSTLHNLDQVIEGELSGLFTALRSHHHAELMRRQAED